MINEFTGYLKFTPKFAKCEPLIVYGHWVLKDIGKSFKVWCNDGLYANGINAGICEIYKIEK